MGKFASAVIQFVAIVWATLVVHAWTMEFRTVFMSALVPDRGAHIFPGLMTAIVEPQHPILYAWPYGIAAMTSVCVYGVLSCLWTHKGWVRLIPLASLLAAIGLMAQWIAWATQGSPSHAAFEWSVRLVNLGAMTAAALWIRSVVGRRAASITANLGRENRRSAAKKSGRYDLGFTIVELLVVVAILMVLAGITFAVMASSKAAAQTTREIAQIRQVYIGVNLYEADNEHLSPRSLPIICPTYVPSSILRCPTDVRNSLAMTDWPANPWVNIVPPDSVQNATERSRFINSYFYLKPFEGRFAQGHTFDEFRNDPTVGLISGAGLMKCGSTTSPGLINGCVYWVREPAGGGQPPANLYGAIVTIRTDGSVATRRCPDCGGTGTLGDRQLFFFTSLACVQRSITGP